MSFTLKLFYFKLEHWIIILINLFIQKDVFDQALTNLN